jgi:hypothetical protein
VDVGHNTKLGWLTTRQVLAAAQLAGSKGLLYTFIKELVRKNPQVAAMLRNLEAHYAAGERSPWAGKGLVVRLDVGPGGGEAAAGGGGEAARSSGGSETWQASWLQGASGQGPVDLEALLASGQLTRIV